MNPIGKTSRFHTNAAAFGEQTANTKNAYAEFAFLGYQCAGPGRFLRCASVIKASYKQTNKHIISIIIRVLNNKQIE